MIAETNKKIFSDMLADKHNCFYCVHNYTSDEIVNVTIQLYQQFTDQENKLVNLRCSLCYFALFNAVILFFVYGGSISINTFTIVNTLFVLMCQFTKEIKFISLMESLVVLLSFIILIKAVMCVCVNICVTTIKTFVKDS